MYFRPTALPIDTGPIDTGFDTMRVTSRFGWRDNPLNPGTQVFHGGLDIGNARLGDDIIAARSGRVIAAGFLLQPWSIPAPINSGWEGGNYGGNMVVIDHGDGDRTIYAHMRSRNVDTGDVVAMADKIGEVGDSGSAQGQGHLHFGLQRNNADIDPLPYLQLVGASPLYDDIGDSPFRADIEAVGRLGILRGIKPRIFGPKSLITREQLATVIMRTLRHIDSVYKRKD